MSTYDDWISMYSSTMDNIGAGKSKHLRKLDLLLSAFDQEVSVIKNYMETAYLAIQTNLRPESPKENIPLPQGRKQSEHKSPIKNKFTKPKNLRLKKSPAHHKTLIKESPDMFNQSGEVNCFNQNIASLSDCDSILASPEKLSPVIKKKRNLRHMKSKEFTLPPVVTKTPKLKNIIDLEMDDVIESTPELACSSKSKASIRATAKKKLFERPAPKKCSQSMYTLTQMYKNQTLKNASLNEHIGTETQVLRELNNQNQCDNQTPKNEGMQNSMLDIDDLLEKLKDDSRFRDGETADETEICSIPMEKPKQINCRQCDIKGSPCRRHMEPIILREPDDTFSGFWSLNFSVKQNKPKADCDDCSQESTVFR